MNKAVKYRIYPTPEQKQKMLETFGCSRFVYNYYLALQKERYAQGQKRLSRTDCNNDCNRVLKKEYPWLKEVDKFALTNSIYGLENGFRRFFQKKGGYPRFKSRHLSKTSYTTNFTNNNIKVLEGAVQLPKLGKVKAVIHREIPSDWRIKQATVSQERDGSCYVSVLCEYERTAEQVDVCYEKVLGLDYKSDGLYMDSEGHCAAMPHFYRRNQKKLAKAQRKLKKKTVRSKNYARQQKKIAKIHRKSANQRKDYLHKKSTETANQYDLVCVESLNMRRLANQGFGNGKATMDNGYGMFLTMLEYKLADRGKCLVKVDPWFPSTKTCCLCGRVKEMVLSDRRYVCSCGNEMDRDHNAAVNIRNKGYEMYCRKVA